MISHSRNFGVYADEIVELSLVLRVATGLGVELDVNWDVQSPALWELEFIRNVGSVHGAGTSVLRLLTVAADASQKTIIGFAQNMRDSQEPPGQSLMTWYTRHGFELGCVEAHGVQIKRASRAPNQALARSTPPRACAGGSSV